MPSMRLSFNTGTTIYQPIDKVWDTISNFHDMSWCPNVVASCVPVGDISGDKAGAARVLNDAFHEILKEVNASNHTIRYAIEKAPPPISDVSGFAGEIKLAPVMDGVTQVQWSASWNASSHDGVEFCNATYVAMLDDLRAGLEGN